MPFRHTAEAANVRGPARRTPLPRCHVPAGATLPWRRMVRVAGLEPAICYQRRILNPLRLPFRHTRIPPRHTWVTRDRPGAYRSARPKFPATKMHMRDLDADRNEGPTRTVIEATAASAGAAPIMVDSGFRTGSHVADAPHGRIQRQHRPSGTAELPSSLKGVPRLTGEEDRS